MVGDHKSVGKQAVPAAVSRISWLAVAASPQVVEWLQEGTTISGAMAPTIPIKVLTTMMI